MENGQAVSQLPRGGPQRLRALRVARACLPRMAPQAAMPWTARSVKQLSAAKATNSRDVRRKGDTAARREVVAGEAEEHVASGSCSKTSRT